MTPDVEASGVRCAAERLAQVVPLILGAVLFLVSASVPFFAAPQYANDDGLYARLAIRILHTGWLGAYSDLTLAKSPFYPMFLAASSLTGLPFQSVQALIYVVGCILLGRAIGTFSGWRLVGSACTTLLLLNPALFEQSVLRMGRENLYAALTVLLVALALTWHNKRSANPVVRTLLGIATGLSFAALWLTREEATWILPPAILMAGMHLLACLPFRRRGLLREAAQLGVIGITAVAGVGAVCVVNAYHYGVADVVEARQHEFVAAMATLARIRPDDPRPHVSFPRSHLEEAYRVSPAAAELQPYLEGPAGVGIQQAGCEDDGMPIVPCDSEFRNAWFLWALRFATASAGHYGSATEARAFYARLADEVNAACADGRLTCGPPADSLLSLWRWRNAPMALEAALAMIRRAATLSGWWWQTNEWGVWWPPLPPVSCHSRDPLPMCADDGWFFDIANTSLFVTRTGPVDDAAYVRSMRAGLQLPSVQRALAIAGVLYRVRVVLGAVLPSACILAATCFIIAAPLQVGARRWDPLWLAALLCAVIMTSRIATLAVADAILFNTVRVIYLTPVYPFLFAFCVLAPMALYQSIRHARGRVVRSADTVLARDA